MVITDKKTELATSLYDLLQSKPMQEITVLQIAKNCGLSTRSFYNHFSDKHELMNYIYYCINEPCWFVDGQLCSLKEGFLRFVEESRRHPLLWLNAYRYAGQNNIRDFVLTKTRSDLRRLLLCNGHPELLDDLEVSEIIDYHSFAMSAMMEHNCTCLPSHKSDLRLNTILSTLPSYLYDIFTATPPPLPPKHKIGLVSPYDLSWPPKLI